MLKHVGIGNLIICNVPESELRDTKKCTRLEGIQLFSEPLNALPGMPISRMILLDQCATDELSPSDDTAYDYVVCGGILGTDEFEGPVVDRTAEIRQKGVACRHLGSVQMTADTAVIVAHRIVNEGQRLGEMAFVDRPSIALSKHELVEMPFRYLAVDANTHKPMLPEGMVDLWRRDGF
jgi:ribosome biogenesis SPOUT family RNA methylase Rps3